MLATTDTDPETKKAELARLAEIIFAVAKEVAGVDIKNVVINGEGYNINPETISGGGKS